MNSLGGLGTKATGKSHVNLSNLKNHKLARPGATQPEEITSGVLFQKLKKKSHIYAPSQLSYIMEESMSGKKIFNSRHIR